MNAIFAELLTMAKKLDNYEIDPVTGLKVLWASTTSFVATVPSDKRWFLLYGFTYRNVSSTVAIYIKDSADDIMTKLLDEAAATGSMPYPDTTLVGVAMPLVMDAGDYVDIAFGTAQDAGSYCSAVVLEVDI